MAPKAEGPTAEEEEAFEAALVRRMRRREYQDEIQELTAGYRSEVMDSKPILDTVGLLLLNAGLASLWFSALEALSTGPWSDRTAALLGAAFISFVIVSIRIGRIVDIIARRTLLEWLCLLNVSHPDTWRSATFTTVWRVVQVLAQVGMMFVVINLGSGLARMAKTVTFPADTQTQDIPPLP